jgi:hypothetical protein
MLSLLFLFLTFAILFRNYSFFVHFFHRTCHRFTRFTMNLLLSCHPPRKGWWCTADVIALMLTSSTTQELSNFVPPLADFEKIWFRCWCYVLGVLFLICCSPSCVLPLICFLMGASVRTTMPSTLLLNFPLLVAFLLENVVHYTFPFIKLASTQPLLCQSSWVLVRPKVRVPLVPRLASSVTTIASCAFINFRSLSNFAESLKSLSILLIELPLLILFLNNCWVFHYVDNC